MNKTCERKIIISLNSPRMPLIQNPPLQFTSVCYCQMSLTIQIYWTKKSPQLCKIEHSMDFGKWITVPQIPFYDNVRQGVVMILVQFWIMSLSFSVINLLLFSIQFSAFTTIGICSFFCNANLQQVLGRSYSKHDRISRGEGDTITALENIFFEMK